MLKDASLGVSRQNFTLSLKNVTVWRTYLRLLSVHAERLWKTSTTFTNWWNKMNEPTVPLPKSLKSLRPVWVGIKTWSLHILFNLQDRRGKPRFKKIHSIMGGASAGFPVLCNPSSLLCIPMDCITRQLRADIVIGQMSQWRTFTRWSAKFSRLKSHLSEPAINRNSTDSSYKRSSSGCLPCGGVGSDPPRDAIQRQRIRVSECDGGGRRLPGSVSANRVS